MRFYAPFITEATLQVTMALRSERAMVGRRQKYRGGDPRTEISRVVFGFIGFISDLFRV